MRPRVAPGLERVRERHEPSGGGPGLVPRGGRADAEGHARHGLPEARRGERRVAVEHEQLLHPPRLHVRPEIVHAGCRKQRRLQQVVGLAPPAQRLVDGVDQRMRFRRQRTARMDEGAAVRRSEVLHDGPEPARRVAPCAARRIGAEHRAKRAHHLLHHAGSCGVAVVRRRADQGRGRLHRVNPAHARPHRVAPLAEIASVPHMPGRRAQKVAVQSEDHVGLVEPRHDRHRLPVCHLRAPPGCIGGERLPDMPPRLRILGDQRLDAAGQRRRADRPGQDPEPLSPRLREPCALLQHGGQQRLPFARPALVLDPGGTVGVVEVQDGRLRPGVRGAQAARVVRIALNLDRPPHRVLDHDTQRRAVREAGRRVVVRDAGHDPRRRDDGRHINTVRRGRVAAGQPSQGEARGHELEHGAPVRGGQGRVAAGLVGPGRGVPAQRWHVEHSSRLRLPMP